MNDDNQKSSIINYQSPIVRSVLIALLALLVLAIGHYGVRGLMAEPEAAGSGGVHIQVGPGGGRDAADVPPPPQSQRGYAQTSRGGPERVLAAYASPEAPAAVIAFYQRTMPLHGWTEGSSAPGPSAQGDYAGTMLQYSNTAKDLCMIVVSEAPSGGSNVTVFRWPASRTK